ncbi:MAG: leucine-rich repeat protein [Eubacteriales bacterium]|nr:leucine-rich repeat protein [Eubacteriales bacterium]
MRRKNIGKRILVYSLTAAMIFSNGFVVPQTMKTVQAASGFTVTGGTQGIDYSYENGQLKILNGTEMKISGSTTDTIYIVKDANLILSNLTIGLPYDPSANNGIAGITVEENSGGTVNLMLEGTNYIDGWYGGIQKNGTVGQLTISGKSNAKLNVNSWNSCAAIGSSVGKDTGNIAIISGSITAKSNGEGAAIGSGKNGSVSNIQITGGTVDAKCKLNAAAIGGGGNGNANGIYIKGGNVSASPVDLSKGIDDSITALGAAIGGGSGANGNNIEISGGIVKVSIACPSSDVTNRIEAGAAIGGGNHGNGSNITISGGEVTVTETGLTSGKVFIGGAAIGGGYGADGENITISGGDVDVVGGKHAAAIGGGVKGNGKNIQITGGKVKARAYWTCDNHYYGGAAIGDGGCNTSDVNSLYMNKSDVSILGGTIDATGSAGAAAIGARAENDSKVYISGGSVNGKAGKSVFIKEQTKTVEYYPEVIGSGAKGDTSVVAHSTEQTAKKVTLNTYRGYTANEKVVPKLIDANNQPYSGYGTNDIYADSQGIIYLYLEDGVKLDPSSQNLACKHTGETETRDAKEATCKEKGYTGDVYCKTCQELIKKGTEIAVIQHVTELKDAKAATCKEKGYTGDEYCKNCQELIKKGTEIAMVQHITELKNVKEATCKEKGYTGDVCCTLCKEVITRGKEIASPAHVKELRNAKEATCKEKGYTGDEYCKVCQELLTKGKEIAVLEHITEIKNVKKATCKEKGYTGDTCCKICNEVIVKGQETDIVAHTWELKVEKEATVEAEGYQYEYCKVCGVKRNEKTLPKLEKPHVHVGKKVAATTPTCLKEGNITYYTCSNTTNECGKLFKDATCSTEISKEDTVLPKTDHKYGEWVVVKPATCIEKGKSKHTCMTSGCTKYEEREDNALKHDFSEQWTSDGNTHWKACKRTGCDVKQSQEQHNMVTLTDVVPTEEKEGKEHDECSVCHYKKEAVTLPKIEKAHVHAVKEKIEAIPATCEKDGMKEYFRCECGMLFKDSACTEETKQADMVQKAFGHKPGEWKEEKAASCIVAGKSVRKCENQSCEWKEEKAIEPLGHKMMEEWQKDAQKHWKKCEVKDCEYIDSEEEHTWKKIVDKQATEEEEGSQHEECVVCKYAKEPEVIEKLEKDHVHEPIFIPAIPAECEKDGTIEYYFCKCGKIFMDKACEKEINFDQIGQKALGHQFGEWRVWKEPTAVEDGIEKRVCVACEKEEARGIAATGEKPSDDPKDEPGDQPGDQPGGSKDEDTKPNPETPSTEQKPEVKTLKKGTSKTDKKTNSKIKVVSSGKVKNGKVTGAKVEYVKPAKSSAKVKVPESVKIGGVTYKVTAISANAFKNDKKVKEVTISSNVTTIGANAFSGCKKLKKITIKSANIKSIGKNALKNIDKRATIYVPKKQYSKYKKLLTAKTGYKKTMKIKKR